MKKNLFILMTFVFMIMLASCTTKNNKLDQSLESNAEARYVKEEKKVEIDTEMITRIKTTYLNRYVKNVLKEATVDDIDMLRYYGEYNNAYVVMMDCGYLGHFNWICVDKIANVTFTYSNSISILVWYEEDFYTLKEAYGHQLLTSSDLLDIAEYHNNYKR